MSTDEQKERKKTAEQRGGNEEENSFALSARRETSPSPVIPLHSVVNWR